MNYAIGVLERELNGLNKCVESFENVENISLKTHMTLHIYKSQIAELERAIERLKEGV